MLLGNKWIGRGVAIGEAPILNIFLKGNPALLVLINAHHRASCSLSTLKMSSNMND